MAGTEHAVGSMVVLCGTITAVEGDIALVRVDRSFPAGGTVTVRLGTPRAAPAADEVSAARVQRALRKT
jgi:hypothetical protein